MRQPCPFSLPDKRGASRAAFERRPAGAPPPFPLDDHRRAAQGYDCDAFGTRTLPPSAPLWGGAGRPRLGFAVLPTRASPGGRRCRCSYGRLVGIGVGSAQVRALGGFQGRFRRIPGSACSLRGLFNPGVARLHAGRRPRRGRQGHRQLGPFLVDSGRGEKGASGKPDCRFQGFEVLPKAFEGLAQGSSKDKSAAPFFR